MSTPAQDRSPTALRILAAYVAEPLLVAQEGAILAPDAATSETYLLMVRIAHRRLEAVMHSRPSVARDPRAARAWVRRQRKAWVVPSMVVASKGR